MAAFANPRVDHLGLTGATAASASPECVDTLGRTMRCQMKR